MTSCARLLMAARNAGNLRTELSHLEGSGEEAIVMPAAPLWEAISKGVLSSKSLRTVGVGEGLGGRFDWLA